MFKYESRSAIRCSGKSSKVQMAQEAMMRPEGKIASHDAFGALVDDEDVASARKSDFALVQS